MARILWLTKGPEDWRGLLANPVKLWKSGYSACTLAHCWEDADGFPPEIARAFRETFEPPLTGVTPLLAVPEFKVPLPGGARASQNDIFVLARSPFGPVAIMVEGKVNESFGPTLEEWQREDSPGKQKRLAFLLRTLGLGTSLAGTTRYQLLHRAASAIITAEQYRAVAAVLLVHSFSEEHTGWTDYRSFARLFGVQAIVGSVQRLGSASTVPLFGLWAVGDRSFLQR